MSGTVAAVDLNVIPSSMVDRYEILKDGASSIYGSDAVAGVVNIITKNDFDGIEMEADAAVPLEGAGETYNVAVTFGRVRDAWHILGGVEYYQQNAIRTGDRSWANARAVSAWPGHAGPDLYPQSSRRQPILFIYPTRLLRLADHGRHLHLRSATVGRSKLPLCAVRTGPLWGLAARDQYPDGYARSRS